MKKKLFYIIGTGLLLILIVLLISCFLRRTIPDNGSDNPKVSQTSVDQTGLNSESVKPETESERENETESEQEILDIIQKNEKLLDELKVFTETVVEQENEYSDELNNYSNGISSFVKALYADDIAKMEEMHKTNNELMEEVEEECDIARDSMENGNYSAESLQSFYEQLDEINTLKDGFADDLLSRKQTFSISNVQASQEQINSFYTNVKTVLQGM